MRTEPLSRQPGMWSIRCYRLLMRLYPRQFLDEVGDSVDQAFRDLLRDAYQKRGRLGIAMLWFRIIPDFAFSAFELLTSTSGDFLKWYFRLRWVLACCIGLMVGNVVADTLASAGVLEALGLPRNWGLAGIPLWFFIGMFQATVLTRRFTSPSRWIALTTLGGAIGIIAGGLLSWTVLPDPTSLDSAFMTWVVYSAQGLFVPILMGLFQSAAFRERHISAGRWVAACVLGAYAGFACTAITAAPLIGYVVHWTAYRGNILFSLINVLTNAIPFGLITAGPLKRMLGIQSPGSSESSAAAES